ncbi:MAG: PAC2 family protein [Aquiluna sp.]|uniref:PAC2 family protein n=1 Tax=Aquiluna sp. TaxID=2053504 RepID=UPI002752FE0F|nr:PAC2 family protein [Aquiluna sp.]MDP4886832.1 PAC2 family protein [Aquiluna sp.]
MLAGRILLVAFEGWNDATEAASGALRSISDQFKAQTLEAVDPEDYYDFQFSRPMLELDEDGNRSLSWPGTELLQASAEGIKDYPGAENIYLLLGTEPSRRWISFAGEVLEMIQDREIDTVIMLGAMLADVPHTRPMPIFKSSQNKALQQMFALEPSKYEGPVGILTVLSQAFEGEGIPVLSLWGSVPHYVHNTQNPKASLGFLSELSALTGFDFDTSALAESAFDWERSIDELSETDDEMAGYIEQLEKSRDAYESELASGDAIAKELEKFLKERPEAEGKG